MCAIQRKHFFSDFGDRLIMSAVVTDLLEFVLCERPTTAVLISCSHASYQCFLRIAVE